MAIIHEYRALNAGSQLGDNESKEAGRRKTQKTEESDDLEVRVPNLIQMIRFTIYGSLEQQRIDYRHEKYGMEARVACG